MSKEEREEDYFLEKGIEDKEKKGECRVRVCNIMITRAKNIVWVVYMVIGVRVTRRWSVTREEEE